ncbi:hypothetical protein Tco_1125120 [Tanacetum coccineum]|uniref:Reverse transcriptase domain-containing protein n=1 Tax=Tanacetum coccineum TaxID=301880 RepID=A0ABQ5J9T3_9ASTR
MGQMTSLSIFDAIEQGFRWRADAVRQMMLAVKTITSRYSIHPDADKMYYDLRDLCWWPGFLQQPELVQETIEKIFQIKERLKTARSRQKSYADKRRKPLEFKIGDQVLSVMDVPLLLDHEFDFFVAEPIDEPMENPVFDEEEELNEFIDDDKDVGDEEIEE